jgi:hypothetical protein
MRAVNDDRLSEARGENLHGSGYDRVNKPRTIHLDTHLNDIFGRMGSTGVTD